MPELPEVETIRRDLQRVLVGKKILDLRINDPRLLTGISPSGRPRRKINISQFKKNVVGKKINCFQRRGKYLIMQFQDGTSLVFHLRMTGQITLKRPENKERAVLFLTRALPLCFTDTRRFGEMIYSQDWEQEKMIRSLGIEPLNGQLSASLLHHFCLSAVLN